MSFSLREHHVWDFWFAQDQQTYHMFFLTAPRTSEDEDLRHPHARIGHATSEDLRNWTYHGVVIRPSDTSSWDDGTTWTGSVVRRDDGKWMMFYTGCSQSDGCKIQRIGAATSDDLFTWEKIPHPLLEISGSCYERYDPLRWHDQAFRDPWVYRSVDGSNWRMVFTARDPNGDPKGAGLIGQAHSPDLVTWMIDEPLFRAGYYGEMEVPQIFSLNGWWFCLFSNSSRHRLPRYLASGGAGKATGTHYIRARSPDGPYELVEEPFFAGDDVGHLYGGRTVTGPDGTLVFMAFLNHASDGRFIGAISDPMPIWTTQEGLLRIDASQYGINTRREGDVAASSELNGCGGLPTQQAGEAALFEGTKP